MQSINWNESEIAKIAPIAANELVLAVIKGEGLRTGDPFFVLRELLIEEQVNRQKYNRTDILAGVVKIWNLKRVKEKILRPGRIFKHDWDKFPKFR